LPDIIRATASNRIQFDVFKAVCLGWWISPFFVDTPQPPTELHAKRITQLS